MAHFAKLDKNNYVTQVIVVSNQELMDNGIESEQKGIDFLNTLFDGRFVQTSYNNNFRKQFATLGSYYDEINDVFVLPKPYDSWTLNENFDWVAPIEQPVEGSWYWDENTLSWLEDIPTVKI